MSTNVSYGVHAVRVLLTRSPDRVRKLWLQGGKEGERLAELRELATRRGIPIAGADPATLDKLSENGRHQGVVAEVAARTGDPETMLEVALSQEQFMTTNGKGEFLEPLPAAQQPDQDDPVEGIAPPGDTTDPDATPDPGDPTGPADEPRPGKPGANMPFGLPAFQLFDRESQLWVEFPAFEPAVPYRIANPERYVDNGGSVLMRFVNRAEAGQFGEEQVYFQVATRIEGTIE